ncbi:MAG TPA: DUF5615 family PIN-like protein [Terriglobales bacterium]|nr:DUF5615 family PIN-like protein [Terriglobales bacterium]
MRNWTRPLALDCDRVDVAGPAFPVIEHPGGRREIERPLRAELSDPEVLELAAAEGRVLVSHDTSTMPVHFAERSHLGLPNPGVLLAFQNAAIGNIIESLLLVWSASREEEWTNQIHYLPALSRHVFR